MFTQIKLKHWLFFYAFFLFFAFFLFYDYQKIQPQNLEIHYLNVGQGDATLLITPANQKILIDTGPPGELDQNLKKYFSFFDKKINLLILTHSDLDHIGNAFNLLQNFSVQQVILPQEMQEKAEFNGLLSIIKNRKIPVLFANQNTDLKIEKEIFVDFLFPLQDTSFQTQNNLSNSSLVLKIIYDQTAFLFSGDASNKEEKEIVLTPQNLQANLYQVGHHGSKTASSEIFLQSIQPQISIVSAEKNNSFGHPHLETIKRLKEIKSAILQTLQAGTLNFSSNGKSIWKN